MSLLTTWKNGNTSHQKIHSYKAWADASVSSFLEAWIAASFLAQKNGPAAKGSWLGPFFLLPKVFLGIPLF